MLYSMMFVRPVISIDAAHMKTTGGGGTLYIASVKSATDEIYPVALSLMVEPENKAGWKWFLEHLQVCLPILEADHRKEEVAYKRFTFMSDRHKGLTEALKEVFPRNHSCYCAVHIARNVQSLFGKKSAKFVVPLSKTFSTTHAEDLLRRMVPLSRDYIARIDPQVWRSVSWLHDESLPPRYGIVTSNMSEATNSMFEDARDVHWLSSLNMMLTKMVERIAELSAKYKNQSGVVESVTEILRNHWKACSGLMVISMNHESQQLFTVMEPPRIGINRDQTGYNVHLGMKACDCGLWQEHGYPCIHAAAIMKKEQRVSFEELVSLVDDVHTYEYNIELFKNNFLTVCVDKVAPDMTVLPPLFPTKRKGGRPKKKRFRKRSRVASSPTATTTAGGSTGGSTVRCSRCGRVGHNVRTCVARETEGTAHEGGEVDLDLVIPDVNLL